MGKIYMGLKDNKWNNRLFIGAIVLFKLVLMGLFSSDYQDLMFIPFVKTFFSGHNPYEFYYQNELLPSFPYFPYMLFMESIGAFLLSVFSPESIFWQNFLFKLPLFVIDCAGFFILRKMNVRFKYAAVLYFCSPIIIFGTYIHGQLDIIPTVLLLVSVYYLLDWKNKYNLLIYAIFLGLAVGCKFHIVAAVPILFFYVAKKKSYFTSVKYHLISALVITLPCIFFWGEGFVSTVLFNKEQSALLTVNIDYGTVSLAIPVLALVIIYLNVYELNYFNKNLLISMLGLLFSTFLICLSPMPAWYIWIVPFYTLYFNFVTDNKYKIMLVYALFNILYLVYFVFLHITGFSDIIFLDKSLQSWKIDNMTLKVCIFTLMVACLCVMVYKIYRFGIASNNLYQRRGRAFVIGIAGDSGAGKSRLLEKIEHLFGTEKDVLFIEGDGDHRWERGNENWEQYTALNPLANYLYRQAENIRELKRGNHVLRSDYSHESGTFTSQRRINARKYIVLCGLHSLYLPILREELDLKIFMDTDSLLRNYWKIERDMQSRGYSKEQILEMIEKRKPDAEKYIYPQKQFADMVISYYDKTLKDMNEKNHPVELSVRFELNINLDVEELISSFEVYGVHPEHKLCEDFNHQILSFDGKEIKGEIDFSEIAEKNIPQYEDFFTYYPNWGTDVEGVIQIMILFMISKKMRG